MQGHLTKCFGSLQPGWEEVKGEARRGFLALRGEFPPGALI